METSLLRQGYELRSMTEFEGGGVLGCFSDLVHFFKKSGVYRWGRRGQDTLSVLKFLQRMFLAELLVPGLVVRLS